MFRENHLWQQKRMRASFAGVAICFSRTVALLHAFLLWPALACIDALQVVSVFNNNWQSNG